MMRAIAASLLVVAVGCSPDMGNGNDPAPVLEVTSPSRGALADGESVTVTGRVTDNGSVRVTVGGVDAPVAKDGSFSATVPVMDGIALIETHAIDGAGNDVRDVRAVLAGSLAPSDGSTAGEVGARAGVGALRAVGNAVATQVNNVDFQAAAMAMNPVYDNGGCLGARINITNVTLGTITANLVPTAGALTADVEIPNVYVRMDVRFKVACIGGGSTVTLRASKAKISGALGLDVASGSIVTSLPTATVAFEGFDLDMSGIAGAVDGLVRGEARKAAEKLLTDQIKTRVPPLANQALAGLISRPITTSLMGHETSIAIAPSTVRITPEELFVGLSTKIRVAGGEGGTYMTTQAPLAQSTMGATQGLGVALDDDIANQLFAGLWSAGAMDQTISIDALPALGALFDDDSRSIDISMSLPPTVNTAAGELVLALGDMIVTVRDEAGGEVHKVAISLTTELAATPTQEGRVALSVSTPTVYAQVLANGAVVEEPLTDSQVEALVSAAWGLVGVKADDALAKLPMPSIGGIQLGAPTLEAQTGFVVADIPVM